MGLKASFAFFPYLRYQGEGRWNLRQDFRQDPSFRHQSETKGWGGWEGLLGLYYRPGARFEFEVGARAWFFRTQDGTDTTFFSDNTSISTPLDRAETWRIGLYFQLTGRF